MYAESIALPAPINPAEEAVTATLLDHLRRVAKRVARLRTGDEPSQSLPQAVGALALCDDLEYATPDGDWSEDIGAELLTIALERLRKLTRPDLTGGDRAEAGIIAGMLARAYTAA